MFIDNLIEPNTSKRMMKSEEPASLESHVAPTSDPGPQREVMTGRTRKTADACGLRAILWNESGGAIRVTVVEYEKSGCAALRGNDQNLLDLRATQTERVFLRIKQSKTAGEAFVRE